MSNKHTHIHAQASLNDSVGLFNTMLLYASAFIRLFVCLEVSQSPNSKPTNACVRACICACVRGLCFALCFNVVLAVNFTAKYYNTQEMIYVFDDCLHVYE